MNYTDISKLLSELQAQKDELEAQNEELHNLLAENLTIGERFRSIAALSPDIISIINADGTLAYNSPAAHAIHGYSDEEMSGQNTFELIHPEDQDAVSNAFNALLSGTDSTGIVQYRYRNKDGKYVWMEATASNQLANPHIKGVVTISRDISKRKQLEKEVDDLEQNMMRVQKIESLGVLAGGIAHDFNNILTGIIGNISYALKFIDESSKAAVILQSAETAASRAGELSNQLLTFAKGGEPLKKVVTVKRMILETTSFVLHGSNVTCDVTLPDDLLAINVDEGQISQALNNIVINASQAMPGGGVVRICAENMTIANGNKMALPAGRYVSILIEDHGCGISDENQSRIFDPYFTTKAGGSGLGLATTHSIITRHGGYIGVRSAINNGTVFEIVLPACDAVACDTVTSSSTETPPENGLSLLVMDDEEIIRDLAGFILTDLGYHVQTCANGDEAVAMYTSAANAGAPYSAVLMDLTIPGGTGGMKAAQQILALDPKARLIVSSGYSNDPVMAECTTYGFSAVLKKPYTEEELTAVVNGVLADVKK